MIVAFLAMLLMQLFAIIVSGTYARRTSIDNAERSIVAASDREIAGIVSFLQPAERIASDTAELIDRGVIAIHDGRIDDYLYSRLASTEQVSAAHVAGPDGSFMSITRVHDGSTRDGVDVAFRTQHISFDATTGERTVSVADFDAEFRELDRSLESGDSSATVAGDPRQNTWYLAALGTTRSMWNAPYRFSSTGELGITVSRSSGVLASSSPVLDHGVGPIIGVDVELSGLSRFVGLSTTTAPEEAFVVAFGYVIAAPPSYELIATATPGNATSGNATPGTATSGNATSGNATSGNATSGNATSGSAISGTASTLGLRAPADFGLELSPDTDVGVGRSGSGDSTTLIARRDFPQTTELGWEIIVRAPESAYTGAASLQQRLTLVLSIGGALLLAFAVLAMWRATNPLGKLQEEAATDPLTGLANRRTITAVGQTMLRELRSGEYLAVLILDLDRFKELNDVHGHHIGDQALIVVANRLTTLTRRGDLVGRLGGDEFVVALAVGDTTEGTHIAARIIRQLTNSLAAALPEAELGVTGGLTIGDDGIRDFDQLLIEADAALLHAKDEAKGMMMVAERVVSSSVAS